MEMERQKSKCIRGSTGTTSNLILAILASLYFLKNNYVIGLVSTVSLGLLGKNVRPVLLLALATLVQLVVDVTFSSNTVLRLFAVICLLIAGCIVIYLFNDRMWIASVALATSTVTLGLIAILFVWLKMGSISASCALMYLYSLFLLRIFGVLFIFSFVFEKQEVKK